MVGNFFVVDTSVVGAWFIKDRFSASAARFRDAIVNGQVHVSCPDFLLLEVVNMLLWKDISPEDISAALTTLKEVDMDFIPLTAVNFNMLITLATSQRLTSYDALYLTIAEQRDIRLIFADGALLKGAGARGIHIEDFRI